MAEELNVLVEPSTEKPNTPNVDELMAQLAEMKASNERNKLALDKALKEKGDLTKSLRAKQTTEEQEAEERRLADEQRKAEYENAISELNKMKAQQAYASTLADEKTIDNIIGAVDDKDHKAIALIIDNAIKSAVKSAQTEWMKNRPQPQVGQYSSMTKEQIMAIADRGERLKAIAMNPDLFK